MLAVLSEVLLRKNSKLLGDPEAEAVEASPRTSLKETLLIRDI